MLKKIFLALTSEVSETALRIPHHVVTCENKDKTFFPLAWSDGKNKGQGVQHACNQCSLASFKGSSGFNKEWFPLPPPHWSRIPNEPYTSEGMYSNESPISMLRSDLLILEMKIIYFLSAKLKYISEQQAENSKEHCNTVKPNKQEISPA